MAMSFEYLKDTNKQSHEFLEKAFRVWYLYIFNVNGQLLYCAFLKKKHFMAVYDDAVIFFLKIVKQTEVETANQLLALSKKAKPF